MAKLRVHGVTLGEGPIILRPLIEDDWELLYKWENDPEVLYFAEGSNVTSYTPKETRDIFCGVSKNALCFIIEYEHIPIGYCWLQRMNLKRLLRQFPRLDCRRIDLAIGDKGHWGRGIGTSVIRLLTRHGFEVEGADALFGCGVADYNPRSQRAFEKNGYTRLQEVPEPEGHKAKFTLDLMLTRERYVSRRG